MSTRKVLSPVLLTLSLATLSLVIINPALAQEGPGLGVPISEADLAPWDISIETNGEGLPSGSGTVQAGEQLYNAQCLACHGEEGESGLNDALVGGHGTLTELAQVKTIGSYWPYASTVFDYIRRAMPFNTPQTLSDDEVYSVAAYILFLNGIIEEDTVLDANNLADIEMPNADGFVLSYP